MSTTYQELLNRLQKLTPEQLEMNVTVFVTGLNESYEAIQDYPILQVTGEDAPFLVI